MIPNIASQIESLNFQLGHDLSLFIMAWDTLKSNVATLQKEGWTKLFSY